MLNRFGVIVLASLAAMLASVPAFAQCKLGQIAELRLGYLNVDRLGV